MTLLIVKFPRNSADFVYSAVNYSKKEEKTWACESSRSWGGDDEIRTALAGDGKELSWQASRMALESCELTLDDIDAWCLHRAGFIRWRHMNGEYLSDGGRRLEQTLYALLRRRRHGRIRADPGLVPCGFRYVRGCSGGSGGEDVSYYPHAQAAFLTIFDHTTERPLKPNLLWIFALEMNRYMNTYGISKEDIARVSVQHKRNAADHPCALLGDADITLQDVLDSEVLAWPVQRFDVSPVSDGAVAIVMAAEHVARRITDKPSGSKASVGHWIPRTGPTATWRTRDT